MSYQVVFHQKAAIEYLTAYKWYESEQDGLGIRFEERVEKRF